MTDDKPSRRNPAYDLPIFENGYTQFPTILIDELMPIAAGIPASFWKYMLVLWRDVVGIGCDKKGYRANKIMSDFHMDKDTATQWTAALSVSGIFNIAYGRRYNFNAPGVPTMIQYRQEATVEEWECFIAALRDQLLDDKSRSFKTKREGVWGFRISLSYRVDSERQRRGLPRAWDEWHAELEKSGDVLKESGSIKLPYNRPRTNQSRVRNASELADDLNAMVAEGSTDWGDIAERKEEETLARRKVREATRPRTDNLDSVPANGTRRGT